MSHTPGPWAIYDDGPNGSDVILANVEGENWDVAYISNDSCESRPENERKANSRLIAAAPELLERLNAMVSGMECECDKADVEHPMCDICWSRLVIAKAKPLDLD